MSEKRRGKSASTIKKRDIGNGVDRGCIVEKVKVPETVKYSLGCHDKVVAAIKGVTVMMEIDAGNSTL